LHINHIKRSYLAMSYTNPILPGFHPDPSICRVGGDYYLITSSFEYFPGVPLYHSENLVDWEQIGHVLTRESQLPLNNCRVSGGIFAPTIRYNNGRFYMVTTNTNLAGPKNGNFYVWTDDIKDEWSDPVWVDMPGIDPDLFFDDNGDVWFTSNEGQSRINIETDKLIGKPTELWSGMESMSAAEAPHIYKINGFYYTMLAGGGTERGHLVVIARSQQIGGPYESCPNNPILSHRSMDSQIQSTGHGDLMEDENGRWWLVFLATRSVGYPPVHLLGRETFMAPVTWNDDGWPVVNNNQLVPFEVEVSGVPQQQPAWTLWEDDFSAKKLRAGWNFMRNPLAEYWRLDDEKLILNCAPISLDELASPAWVGRRWQHFGSELETIVGFMPQNADEEAGMTLFLQAHTHNEVFVTRRAGKRVAIARRCLGSFVTESEPLLLSEGKVELSIVTSQEWIDMGVITSDGRVSLLKGESKFISTEVGGRFTGPYIALFATGKADGSSLGTVAKYESFRYKVRQ
jgi:alpha-N-arabinofuranosidase